VTVAVVKYGDDGGRLMIVDDSGRKKLAAGWKKFA
jgi:hypothetical protein